MLLGSIQIKEEIKKPAPDIYNEHAVLYMKNDGMGPQLQFEKQLQLSVFYQNKLNSAVFYYSLAEESEMHPEEQEKNEIFIRTTK